MSDRPLPVASFETRPFWTAAAHGRLCVPVCHDCGLLFYPPPPRCLRCLSADLHWQTLSGRARLVAWTEVHVDVLPGVSTPFVVAEVELEEQADLTLVAHLAKDLLDRVRIGLPVQVTFEATRDAQIALPRLTALSPIPAA